MAEYTYQINGVTVGFDRHAIHITNDSNLKSFLGQWGHGSRTLAENAKSKYKSIYGVDLNISVDSLTVEILGHVYAPALLSALRAGSLVGIPSFLLVPFFDILKVIVNEKVSKIDCGDGEPGGGRDKNRVIWDKLAPYRGVFETFLVD